MTQNTRGYGTLLRKLALVSGSIMLMLVTAAPSSAASTSAPTSAASVGAPTPPSPPPSKRPKNVTVTNPKALAPNAPRAGVTPGPGPSRLKRALAAAGLAAPSSALGAGPCTLSGTVRTCELWAKAGTLTLPAQAQQVRDVTIVAPLTVPVWGFAVTATGPALVPGPVLVAYAGETVQIHVHNALPAAPDGENAIAVEILAAQVRPDLQGIERNNDMTWNYGQLNAGTYVYQAGATPFGPRQVRMGLGGVLVVRPALATFQACNCAYGNSAVDGFVDETTVVLNAFDPAFNNDPFGFDAIEFNPTQFTINGLAYDRSNTTAGKIDVASGDRLLIRYANLTEHERGITIANERQTILADDSYILTNPADVATKWLNPGQVSDSFVTVDPSFPVNSHIPVYEAGFHFNNGVGGGLGGMFTYLDVVRGLAGSPTGPVTTTTVLPATNSGTEDLAVSGNMTAGTGATLTDAEWFLDYPGTPGTANTCPVLGVQLVNHGSHYTAPTVTFSGGGGTGAAATVAGVIDSVTVTGGGAGYTLPTATITGATATVSGAVTAVSVATPYGSHYSTPSVGFTGGGGSGAAATATGPVDSVTLGTAGARYKVPSVVFTGGGGSGATASVTGVVDSLTVATPGSGYTAPVVTITGGGGTGASGTAQFDPITGAITGLTITNAGTGYTSAPTVTINDTAPGPGTGATASSTISVTAIALGAGGSAYTSAPTLAINDTGTPTVVATATSTIGVTAVNVTLGGSNYTSAPTVTFADTTGTPLTVASATATLTITSVTAVTNAGVTYTTAPAVAFSDPTGSGATAVTTLTLTTILLTNAGHAYATAPTVNILDAPGALGSGATAIATLAASPCLYQHFAVSGTTFNYSFTIASADLNSLLMSAINRDGDHVIWVHAQDSSGTGTWGVVSGDVFTYNATGPIFGSVTLHSSPTNGMRPTDVANGAGPAVNGVPSDLPNNDLVILGMLGASLSNFVVTAAEYCIDSPACAVAHDALNPTGPTPLLLSPSGSNTVQTTLTSALVQNATYTSLSVAATSGDILSGTSVVIGGPAVNQTVVTTSDALRGATTIAVSSFVAAATYSIGAPVVANVAIDAYGNALRTPIPCTPLASPPGLSPASVGAAPGGGSVASFCGTVPASVLLGMAAGLHTLFVRACEQLAVAPVVTACAPPGAPARWSQFATDASLRFVVDKTGPNAVQVSVDPNPNNGFTPTSGNLSFVDVMVTAATFADPVTSGVHSNIAYAEAVLSCSPSTVLPSGAAACQVGAPTTNQPNGTPIDPTTSAVPPDGTGAEMIPTGGAWDSPTKLAYAYVPLAELTAYPEGYIRFWVHAQDQAGNFGPWFWTDLTYDKTAPVFDTPDPATAPNGIACRTGCTVSFTAHDPLHNGVQSKITQAEWFVGTDPGFGNGTQVTITAGLSMAGSFHVGPQTPGTLITVRVKDAAGNWSLNNVLVTT